MTEIVRVETLDLISLFRLTIWSFVEYWRLFREKYPDYHIFWSFLRDLNDCCVWQIKDVVYSLLVAVAVTFLRHWLTRHVFHPLALRWKVASNRWERIPENLWKMSFYAVTWSYSVYVMWLSGRHNWFWDPISIWDEYDPNMDIPGDIYVMYVGQFGYYIHSVYATVYLDSHRKDTSIMVLHHCITLLLIALSFTTKNHMVGALVLLLMDISDVFLEFWKLNSNLKSRAGGKYHKFHDHWGVIGFIGFSVTWFIFRLYWFSLKVLYTALYGCVAMGKAPEIVPFWMPFNIMLIMLFGLNLYWFALVIIGLYNYAMGNLRELDDCREYDDVSEEEKNPGQQNGGPIHEHES